MDKIRGGKAKISYAGQRRRGEMNREGEARHRNARAKRSIELDEQRIARISGGIAWCCYGKAM